MGNVEQNPQNNNLGFYILLGLILIAVLGTGLAAKQQNEWYRTSQANFYNGMDLYQKGMYQEAEPLLAKAVKYYPSSYNANWLYGDCLFRNKNYKLAISYLSKTEELRPALLGNPKFLLMKASALYESSQLDEAERYANQALKTPNLSSELTVFAQTLLTEIKAKGETHE